jgi:hypothetical protein
MLKLLLIILMLLLLFIGGWSLIDLIISIWLVFRYEPVTVYTMGAFLGKFLFLACTVVVFCFFYRLFRHRG